jgi:hypothetical protein
LEKCIWFLETNPSMDLVNTYSVAFQEERYLHQLTFQKNEMELIHRNLFPVTWMIRSSKMFPFDDTLREGMEDWDFILHFYSLKKCTYTLKEFHFWYRIHRKDGRWKNNKEEFIIKMKQRYPDLFQKNPSHFRNKCVLGGEQMTPTLLENPLQSNQKNRILFVFPNLRDSEENRYHLSLLEGLKNHHHYAISILTWDGDGADEWHGRFMRITSDIFHMKVFLTSSSLHLPFLQYMLKSREIHWVTFSNCTFISENMNTMHSVEFFEIMHSLSTGVSHSHTILFPSQFLLNQFRTLHPEQSNPLHVLYFGLNEEEWKGTLSSNVDRTVSYIISNKEEREVEEWFKKLNFKNEQIYFIFNQENKEMYNVIQKEYPNSISILIPSRMDEHFKLRKLLLYLSFTNFFFISKHTESVWM